MDRKVGVRMADQVVFKRYELKYLLTTEQKQLLLQAMAPYMQPDKYGRTTIRNLYFDTEDHRLIRRSIEKPVYKEKLRIRAYEKAEPESKVFVELKKKYQSVVYKRRISLSEKNAMAWLCGDPRLHDGSQIAREIAYFMEHYPVLRPTVFLSYEREAYFCRDGLDFRVTFDHNILCRQDGFSLGSEPSGTALLPEGMVLMELKCSGGIPFWMTRVLSRERIYKTSFSKYGTAYTQMIFPQLHRKVR